MALRDHIGKSGVVTNQALIATLEEETSTARSAQVKLQTAGQTGVAELVGRSIDENLDRITELKKRSSQ